MLVRLVPSRVTSFDRGYTGQRKTPLRLRPCGVDVVAVKRLSGRVSPEGLARLGRFCADVEELA